MYIYIYIVGNLGGFIRIVLNPAPQGYPRLKNEPPPPKKGIDLITFKIDSVAFQPAPRSPRNQCCWMMGKIGSTRCADPPVQHWIRGGEGSGRSPGSIPFFGEYCPTASTKAVVQYESCFSYVSSTSKSRCERSGPMGTCPNNWRAGWWYLETKNNFCFSKTHGRRAG